MPSQLFYEGITFFNEQKATASQQVSLIELLDTVSPHEPRKYTKTAQP